MKLKYINAKEVRTLAIEVSIQMRAGKFKRVGASFLEDVNAHVRAIVVNKVKQHPSIGKTLK